MNNQITLYYASNDLAATATELIKVIPDAVINLASERISSVRFMLWLRADGLWFYSHKFMPFNLLKFYTEFISKRQMLISKELLIRAANLKSQLKNKLTALDLTAGLGRDSIILALAGYQVTMVENNPYLVIILQYLCHTFIQQLPGLRLVYNHHQVFLGEETASYDLIYLDPMFNDGKVALAKKDMQIIDLLVENDAKVSFCMDNQQLFELCKRRCANKIIIKRDNKQKLLIDTVKPTYNIKGKTVRFDVYQICTPS